jgi:hypothetical protein
MSARTRVERRVGAPAGRGEAGDEHLQATAAAQGAAGGRAGAQVVWVGLAVGDCEAAKSVGGDESLLF